METESVVKEWLTYSEAQRYVSLGRTRLYELAIKEGQIKYARVGHAVRFSRRSLDEFMERHSTH